MSYILDALRRADADRERERGAVPGLHSRPTPAAGAGSVSTAGLRGWMVVVMGLALLSAGAAAMWWLRPAAAPGVAPVVAQVVAPVMASSAVAAPPVVLAAPQTPPAAPAAPVVQPPPLRVVVAPVAQPVSTLAATSPATPTVKVPAAAPAPSSAPASAAQSARPIPLAQLTPEQRRDWPVLAIGGAIYSDSAASRFIMVAGQVVREGEAAAPGVVVQRIGPKSAVMRWRDLLVEVPF